MIYGYRADLASHTLGKVLRCFPEDFENRYGYVPWVIETFVGPEHRGTCFRAAGFQCVGKTKGRGRHAPGKYPSGEVHYNRGYLLSQLGNYIAEYPRVLAPVIIALWWCGQDGLRQFFIISSRFSRKNCN